MSAKAAHYLKTLVKSQYYLKHSQTKTQSFLDGRYNIQTVDVTKSLSQIIIDINTDVGIIALDFVGAYKVNVINIRTINEHTINMYILGGIIYS